MARSKYTAFVGLGVGVVLLSACSSPEPTANPVPTATQATLPTATAVQASATSAPTPRNTPASTATAPAGSASPAFLIQNFRMPPVNVVPGTTVLWTNADTVGHTITSGTPGKADGKFDGEAAQGAKFSFMFKDAGTYPYFCRIHTSMTGTVTVGSAASSSAASGTPSSTPTGSYDSEYGY